MARLIARGPISSESSLLTGGGVNRSLALCPGFFPVLTKGGQAYLGFQQYQTRKIPM